MIIMPLKRCYFETDGKFGTLILELCINMEASGGTVICLTLYYTHRLDALEKATKLLLLMTKATVRLGIGSCLNS